MKDNDLKICAEYFLKHQGQLFDEPVADTVEEAAEFLDDCMAELFDNLKGVKSYFEEVGMDIDGMSDDEIKEQMEVFTLPDGRYFVVEG